MLPGHGRVDIFITLEPSTTDQGQLFLVSIVCNLLLAKVMDHYTCPVEYSVHLASKEKSQKLLDQFLPFSLLGAMEQGMKSHPGFPKSYCLGLKASWSIA